MLSHSRYQLSSGMAEANKLAFWRFMVGRWHDDSIRERMHCACAAFREAGVNVREVLGIAHQTAAA